MKLFFKWIIFSVFVLGKDAIVELVTIVSHSSK